MKIFQSLLVGTFISLFLFTGCNFSGEKQVVFKTDKGISTYKVEVADTKEERMKGLMNRENLDENRGMIFIYDKEVKPAFWMKNTLIPLDMVFMDKDFKVVDYFVDVQPCKVDLCTHYIPSNNAQYIVELNAGQIEKIGLTRGDIAEYK
ncbi:DUF192 domain-containing protein [bacterium]|nr:DUF192 domain-containing protein [bacterium]